MFDFCKWDIQSEDHSVLADFPLFLEKTAWTNLAAIAEALTGEVLNAERELYGRHDLHEQIGLPSAIRKALRRCGPDSLPVGAARVMRFDFHFTSDGWRISEVNADVPGGFIEASGFTSLMAEHFPKSSPPPNPAEAYSEALLKCVSEGGLVGFVHATAHIDDAQVMHYLARQVRERGMRGVLLSPEHLCWEAGRARIVSSFASGDPNVLMRFFPAEWLPRLRSDSQWKPWFCEGRTPMSNPGPAILMQSKRFPLVWSELNQTMATWRTLMPETRCPSGIRSDSVGEWVFKPVFGRVGEDVAIAGITDKDSYKAILAEASRHPTHWVAQRRFESVSLQGPKGPLFPCVGIFTLDGRTIGAYGRLAKKPLIDHEAQDIAVLLNSGANGQND